MGISIVLSATVVPRFTNLIYFTIWGKMVSCLHTEVFVNWGITAYYGVSLLTLHVRLRWCSICQVYFTLHSYLLFYPHCQKWQAFLLSVAKHCSEVCMFWPCLYPFTSRWTVRVIYFLATVNSALKEHECADGSDLVISILLDIWLVMGLLDFKALLTLMFLRNLYKGWTNLHSHAVYVQRSFYFTSTHIFVLYPPHTEVQWTL